MEKKKKLAALNASLQICFKQGQSQTTEANGNVLMLLEVVVFS